MRAATASAPAKAMLWGEYAVLGGAPAVAVALDRRITARSAPAAADGLRIVSPLWERPFDLPWEALDGALPAALQLLEPPLRRWARDAAQGAPGLDLVLDAGFPTAWGLGSSSASTLAAAASLQALALSLPAGSERAQVDEPSARDLELWTIVREAQLRKQGQASGYDAATQLLGGLVSFHADGGGARFHRHPDEPVADSLLVAWSGRKVDTGDMIREVRRRHPPDAVIYAEIGSLAVEARAALAEAGVDRLGRLLQRGQSLLERLGAVPPELAAVLRALAADPDIAGARLSGAGGGDSVLVLARDRQAAARACAAHGLQVLPLRVAAQGLIVRVEDLP